MIGIMGGADQVDVMLFHQGDVLDHGCRSDGLALVGFVFMAVDALDQDAFAIHQHVTVFQLDLAESDLGRNHLQGFPCPSLSVMSMA